MQDWKTHHPTTSAVFDQQRDVNHSLLKTKTCDYHCVPVWLAASQAPGWDMWYGSCQSENQYVMKYI